MRVYADSDPVNPALAAASTDAAGPHRRLWWQHLTVWDVSTSDDSNWAHSLYPQVIATGSDINPVPTVDWNKSGAVPATPVNSSGLAAAPTAANSWNGDSGLLLGDTNHNAVSDPGETTLFFDQYAAQQALLTSVSGDARVIMANQAVAAQLNEYNDYVYDQAHGGLASGSGAEPNGLRNEQGEILPADRRGAPLHHREIEPPQGHGL
jgi:hypothetical protein